MQLVPGMPNKPKVVPGVKMKQLHWNKVHESMIKNSVWALTPDDTSLRGNLDMKEVEALFGQKKRILL